MAQHVKARLPVDLVNQLVRSAAPVDALRSAFAATEAGLAARDPPAGRPDSGCTATAVLLREAALVAAWVGNSRAVLALRERPGPGGLTPQAVMRDQLLSAAARDTARVSHAAGTGGRVVRCVQFLMCSAVSRQTKASPRATTKRRS